MLFPEDSPVSLSPLPAKEEVLRTIDIYGEKCLEWYERLNRHGSSLKMFVVLLLSRVDQHSRPFAMTWKLAVTKYNRLLFLHSRSARATKENDYGLLLTVTGSDGTRASMSAETLANKYRKHPQGNLAEQLCYLTETLPTPIAMDTRKNGPNSKQKNLATVVAELPTLPTVTTINRNSRNAITKQGDAHQNHGSAMGLEQVLEVNLGILPKELETWEEVPKGYMNQTLPTVKSGGWKGAVSHNYKDHALPNIIEGKSGQKTGLKLLPEFTEWMMGYPEGWTDLTKDIKIGHERTV